MTVKPNRLNTEAAAAHIDMSPDTLRVSRCVGTLAGVSPPPFVKIGRKVFYDEADLDKWLAQFKKRIHTKEA